MYDNRNRFILLLLMLALVFSLFTVFIYSEEKPKTSAKAAVLYQPQTETFIYNKEENRRLPMASTTKIMTALIALESLSPDEYITVDDRAIGTEGSSIYLRRGEKLLAIDLIYSVLLQSANDAASALAYEIAGDIESFAYLMNERAAELGLTDTSFKNPHGLDAENHYTTAHDLALITAEALKNEDFKAITSTYKWQFKSSECERLVVNHNKLLKSYDGCVGVKTGYTKKSGRCLSSAALRDEVLLICVTLDAPDDWRDHKRLLDYGFSLYESRILATRNEFSYEIPILGGLNDSVKISNRDELKRICLKTDAPIIANVRLSRYFAAPIDRGDILGVVIFTQNGIEIASLNLVAEDDVGIPKKKKIFPF